MGKEFIEAGYVWSPYVPLVVTPMDGVEPLKFSMKDYLFHARPSDDPLEVFKYNDLFDRD